jgi:tetratricopeptide (TPR) repeat protein
MLSGIERRRMNMNNLLNRTAPEILALALAAFAMVAPASGAQQQNPSQQGQQPQQQQPAKPGEQGQTPPNGQAQGPAEAPKVDPEEEKAYKDFADLKPDDYDKQIQQGEDFVKKYPQSKYDEFIYSRLTNAYYSKQQLDKMYAAGDKALALNPNDVTVLVLVGWVIPHNIDPNDLDSDRRLEKAQGYEKHALEVLPTLPKPATLTDEQFAAAKSREEATAHSGLGLIYFRQRKAEDSLKELQQATAVQQSDPVDFFIMGIDLVGLKRYNDAVDAFQKCAQIPGVMQDRCKQQAEKAKAQAAQPPK